MEVVATPVDTASLVAVVLPGVLVLSLEGGWFWKEKNRQMTTESDSKPGTLRSVEIFRCACISN